MDGVNGGLTPLFVARDIMRGGFLGPEVTQTHFGKGEPLYLERGAPFSERTLREVRGSGFSLVAVPPVSIVEMAETVRGIPGLLYPFEYEGYKREPFANYVEVTPSYKEGEWQWQLACERPHPQSFSLGWERQMACLGRGEGGVSARVMVYLAIARCLHTGQRLFEGKTIYVRCWESFSAGGIIVGAFSLDGLHIRRWPLNDGNRQIGLGYARMPDLGR